MSTADVVQRILDSVVSKCLPSAVLEDSLPYANRKLAHLDAILLMLLSLPIVLDDLQEPFSKFLKRTR